jgi:hypothetical protein
MEKNSHSTWPEIVFGSSDSKVSQAIRRAVTKGDLKKIAPRLYTSNLSDDPAQIIQRNLYHILAEYFPGAILSHRTAIAGGPIEGIIYLTYKYSKKLRLPGLTIHLIKGSAALPGDTVFMEKLFLASRERALLENLQPSRNRGDSSKSLSRKQLESFLEKICNTYGVEELNRLRDKAKHLAKKLNMIREHKTLSQLIGALLGTQEERLLQTENAIARAKGVPYDRERLELFTKLALALQSHIFPIKKIENQTETRLKNIAFFESYFSNYIEGTEFEIEEAADIIFHERLSPYRPEDSHDILGTFQIVADLKEMRQTPATAKEFFSLLQRRHAFLLSARKEKLPGEFKNKVNRAGNTVFVLPELVKGTLMKAFDIYQMLSQGIGRAIFMMFVVSEVHPFLDGNGRIARVMMNSELVVADQMRIIIPTVYREDYILALRRLSREWDVDPYIRMLLRAQDFTASIDYSNYEHALQQLKESHAFLEPSEGKLRFK